MIEQSANIIHGYDLSAVMLETTFFPLQLSFAQPPSFFTYHDAYGLWDCWDARDTGDILTDIKRGEAFAAELLACARANRCPEIISHVVGVIAGRTSRKEIALDFVACSLLHVIAQRAYVAAHH